ncbi:MAG TPA: DUF3306 domain-containing protein [Methylophilaceae bacterium]|nr:DUF3306 domain-containing protein [Methylophilaceae bacterium]HQR60321.1 DUF3306 domain-containing protein [Methylophilaceae bacterium]
MSKPLSFIRRWSRLKLQTAAEPATPVPTTTPALPAMTELGFRADFSPFMHPEVDGATRRTALRKLFMTDHYRTMDGLDVYVEDYSHPAELPAELLATLDHAQAMLAPAEEKTSDPTQEKPELV